LEGFAREKGGLGVWRKIAAGAMILLLVGFGLIIFLTVLLFYAVVTAIGLYVAYRIYRHYKPRSNTIADNA